MISTEFLEGQGLGNQLWCYATTRSIAIDNGYRFGIQSPENFKGGDFMYLDFGNYVDPERDIRSYYAEATRLHPLNGADIREYDARLVKVADGTKIEGNLQDERYILRRKDEIRRWFSIKPEVDRRDFSSDEICVLNFRGSGYKHHPELFLPRNYWVNAMNSMRRINPKFKFIVVTEDVEIAQRFFPDLEARHFSIGEDYAIVKNARYLILSNSSFGWFPAWLSTDLKYCIAPKYWARHNVSDGYWSLATNITEGWMYQDRKGDLFTADECRRELETYMRNNKSLYEKDPSLIRFKALRDFARIFNALRKDFFAPIVLARMTMISTMRLTLKAKHALSRRSAPAGAKGSNKISPRPFEVAKKSFLSSVKDSITTQGYY